MLQKTRVINSSISSHYLKKIRDWKEYPRIEKKKVLTRIEKSFASFWKEENIQKLLTYAQPWIDEMEIMSNRRGNVRTYLQKKLLRRNDVAPPSTFLHKPKCGHNDLNFWHFQTFFPKKVGNEKGVKLKRSQHTLSR